jgi:hypothetical protein
MERARKKKQKMIVPNNWSTVATSQETHCAFIIKTDWLIIYIRGIIAVYSENYTKHKHFLWAKRRVFKC